MRRAGLLLTLSLSCGGMQRTAPSQPTAAQALHGEGCKISANHTTPLVVDWNQDQRTEFEAELRQGTLVVVVYDCNEFRILSDCKLPGDYGYTGVTRKETVQHFEGDYEIGFNLPLNGLGLASLGGKTAASSALDVALVTIGRRRSTRYRAARGDLSGECNGATHFVRGVQIGAFAVASSEKGRAAAAATLFQMSAGGHTAGAHRAVIVDGKADACKPDLDATNPPAECGAPLRVELVGIQQTGTALPSPEQQETQAPTCPAPLVWTGEKCGAPSATTSFVCKPGDKAECDAQCARQNLESCHELAKITEKTDATRAVEMFKTNCDAGLLRSCNSVGVAYATGAGIAKDAVSAAQLYQKACDGGFSTACVNLGAMNFDTNASLGVRLFNRGCDGGEALGCVNVSIAYELGKGVPKDPARSHTFSERACRGGAQRGCTRAAMSTLNGTGVARDVTAGIKRLETVCDASEPTACVALAAAYTKGGPVPEDALRVREYTKKACDAGMKEACGAAGLFTTVDHGDSTVANVNAMFATQCEKGSSTGCALYGHNLITGTGIDRDVAKGTAMLEKACKLGDKKSCEAVKARPTK